MRCGIDHLGNRIAAIELGPGCESLGQEGSVTSKRRLSVRDHRLSRPSALQVSNCSPGSTSAPTSGPHCSTKMRRTLFPSRFHTWIVQSRPANSPVINRWPSRLNFRSGRSPLSALRCHTKAPVRRFVTYICRPQNEATVSPRGDTAKLITAVSCLAMSASSLPVESDNSFTRPSAIPQTIESLSGSNATEQTEFAPMRHCISHEAVSHTHICFDSTVMSREPSGLHTS